ncbi:MAG: RecQ family zinc-binding domain-containing protein, partial [Nocardioidaceae bacterium]|nr:RecQ family zinc-binding domain-containing protein [Nocardioidaceae bacterium]
DEASVVLLPQAEDKDIWAYFSSLAFPEERLVRQTLAALTEAGRPLSTPALEVEVELSRNRLETMLKVLDVDGAVRRVQGGWIATGQEWVYDEERYHRVAEARTRERDAMLDYLATDQCRMWFLRHQLDDPEAERCGRCDNCGGLRLEVGVSDDAVAAAEARLARPGVVLEPRKMWPTGLDRLGLDLRGRIGATEPGRAIARLTDLGHGQQLRDLFRPGAGDGPVPLPLVHAMLDVLRDWQPRPDAIVVVESTTRSRLTRDLADGLSRHLGVPITGRVAVVDPDVTPGRGSANSAQRLAAVHRRYGLVGDVPEGRVLLVDDLMATGWTLAWSAELLRRAGATAVLPLTLAVEA